MHGIKETADAQHPSDADHLCKSTRKKTKLKRNSSYLSVLHWKQEEETYTKRQRLASLLSSHNRRSVLGESLHCGYWHTTHL